MVYIIRGVRIFVLIFFFVFCNGLVEMISLLINKNKKRHLLIGISILYERGEDYTINLPLSSPCILDDVIKRANDFIILYCKMFIFDNIIKSTMILIKMYSSTHRRNSLDSCNIILCNKGDEYTFVFHIYNIF